MSLRMSPALLSAALLILAAVLGAIYFSRHLPNAGNGATAGAEIQRLVFLHATLPRLAIALLSGAGLAMSGAILQQVLRNPLASPSTIGVSAGARLALAISGVFAPALLGFGRDLVAIAGAVVATTLVLFIARRRQYSPLTLILAGLIVSLYCGAVATILVLLKDRYLVGLFIWGSGSLSQQSWMPTRNLALRLGVSLIPLVALLRPLSLFDAGEQAAGSLGVSIERIRVLSVGVAVLMAAFVTSTVGMIGFIDLAGPVLARLSGARHFQARLLWSGVISALLLLVTDLSVQLFGEGSALFLPTGSVTAVIGSPLLLMLLPRLKSIVPSQLLAAGSQRSFANQGWSTSTLVGGAALLILVAAVLPLVGRTPDGGWSIADLHTLPSVLPWRLPRMLAAAGAGCLLAVAGYILQRITANPMASPEIMGVSAGAILGVAVTLLVLRSASSLGLTASATLGSLAALLVVLAISIRASFSPERVLLAGVALTALVDALVGVLTATGDPSSVLLLAWLSGSTNGATPSLAVGVCVAAILMTALSLLGFRWLTILPLGTPTARGVGVPVPIAQALLLFLVALMTAIATPVIGPLTFVGLIAPHIVALKVRRVPAGLVLSAVTGAGLMILADALARTIAFPLQLSTGILACLLAGPFLMLLIASGGKAIAFPREPP
jgi:ferric hydroxamate transport system permease protein